MYSNYGINSDTKVKIKNLNKLLVEAYLQDRDNSLWDVWKLQFPNMDKETYISFEDYKAKLMSQKHTEISYEDIEKEMDKVVKAYERR